MEAIELKKILEAYDNKLDKTLRLNRLSIENLQLEKSQYRTKKILRNRIFEVAIFSLLALFIGLYIANNWGQTHLAISGIIFHIVTLVALAGSIGQVVLLQQIDFSKPIVEIRKKIEQVNAHELLFVKIVFLSAPVWWSYVIVGVDAFLGVDLYLYLEQDVVFRFLVVNFLLTIPLAWFLRKLSYHNLHLKWVKTVIKLFTSSHTLKALEALNEIEEFEN